MDYSSIYKFSLIEISTISNIEKRCIAIPQQTIYENSDKTTPITPRRRTRQCPETKPATLNLELISKRPSI